MDILMKHGHIAKLDEIDSHLAKWKWFRHDGYARRTIDNESASQKWVHMHRIVLERKIMRPLRKGEVPDHINGDRSDNRRENLRVSLASGNSMNTRGRSNASSKYIGVTWRKSAGRWYSKVRFENKDHHVGYFSCEIEAARARDALAKKLHGDFARLNFQEIPSE